MFGGTEPSVSEHRHFPIMKLIDFGYAHEGEDTVEDNLFELSEVVTPLEI